MTYNRNDESRPPNYCGVDFGPDCCPECGEFTGRQKVGGQASITITMCLNVSTQSLRIGLNNGQKSRML